MQDGRAIALDFFDTEVAGRIDDLRVVDGVGKVPPHLTQVVRVNTLYRAVVGNSEKDIATFAIEEGANRFINVAIQRVARSLKFDSTGLARS